jgi:hypothetical protein
MDAKGQQPITKTTGTPIVELEVTPELVNELAQEGYEWALGMLFFSTQFDHPGDEKVYLERRALLVACLAAGRRFPSLAVDEMENLIDGIEDSVAGIAANPSTWDILDRATYSADSARWYRRLKPLQAQKPASDPTATGKAS